MIKTKKLLTVVITVVMLLQSFGFSGFAAATTDFVDFPNNSWSTEAMTAAVDNGLLSGTSETTIEPAKNLTRAEFATIVTRAFGATKTADISKFKDVDADKWYADPIAKVVQMGVMNGTGNTTFAPNAFMRREDVILSLARILFVDGDDTSVLDQFSDRDEIDTWSVKAIAGMVSEGYVNGYVGGTIRPKDYITRQELAQLFHNIFKTYISEDGEYSSVAKKGSVIVRSEYVTLKDVTIDGDLIMADGVGGGDFKISNVHVTGKIIARGGEGMNYFVNVTSDGKVIVNDPNGTVNFYNYREEDTPFKGGNVIENTPATFLERGKDDYKPTTGGGGVSTTYKVEFKNEDESIVKKLSKTNKNYVITEDDVPTNDQMYKVGYEFQGWSQKGSVDVYNRDWFIDKKISEVKGTYYPVYVEIVDEYTITFVTPAGETVVVKNEDETIDASEIPAVDYDATTQEFLGWTTVDGSTNVDYTNEDLTSDAVENIFSSTDVRLYPVIRDKGVTEIIFKHPDGDVKVTKYDDPDYVLTDGDVPADPTKADHVFAGWAKNPAADEGEDRSYFVGKKISEVEGTWYPVFTRDETTYTVFFKYNDGVEINKVEKSLVPSENYVLTSADVSDADHPTAPADYKFIGWSETPGGTAVVSSEDLRVSIRDLNGKIYYAQFEKVTDNYTVVFKYTDGTEINTVEKTLADSENYVLTSSDVTDVDFHTNPDDFNFLGWTDTVDGTDYKTSAELQVSIKNLDGKTYYAQFERNETTYTVYFKYTDGTEINKVEKNLVPSENYVLSSADVSDVDHPTAPADYKFIGWSETANGTTVVSSEDLRTSIRDLDGKTYYAQFEEIPVPVTYKVTFKHPDGDVVVEKDDPNYIFTRSDVPSNPTYSKDYYEFRGWSQNPDDGMGDFRDDFEGRKISELVGVWYPITYEQSFALTFEWESGSESLMKKGSYILQESDIPEDPELEGYTFKGWVESGDDQLYLRDYFVGKEIYDVTGDYVAFFEANFSVSFKFTDNTEALGTVTKTLTPDDDYVLTSSDVYDVDHPTSPADYEFLGWTLAVDGTDYTASSELVGKSIKELNGKTYYAQFEKVTDNYTVVFKYTDGTEINKVEKTLADSENYVLTSSDVTDVDFHTNPDDFNFLGWTDTVDGTDYKTSAELQVSIKNLDGKTYYAQYERNETTYTVSFKYNDGTEINKVEKKLVPSENYSLASADVYDVDHDTAPADYKFIGWSETANGTTVVSSEDLRTSIRDLDGKTYYAQFERNETTYSVTFKYNDGVEINKVEKNLVPSENYVLSSADVSDVDHPTAPADYKFIGWSETANGTAVVSSEDLRTSIKDLDGKTYYAQFEKVTDNYTVVFKYTDGTEINKVEKTLSESEDYVLTFVDVYNVQHNVTPEDYIFLGWTDTVDGTDYKTSDELKVSIKDLDGKTYYAQFEKIEETYVVYFKYNDGTEIKTVEKVLNPSDDYLLSDVDVIDAVHPTNPGDYTFLGWTDVVDGTYYIPSSDFVDVSIRDLDGKTYYAQFESKESTFTVTFLYTDGTEIKVVEKRLLPSEDYVLTASDVSDVAYHTNPEEYTFLGWTDTVDGADYKTSAELQVSIRDLESVYYAQFKHIDDVVYTVEHYFEQVDGTYELDTTETFYARPGTTVTANALTTLPDGYKPYAGELPEGVVAEDGSLVLELYYELEVISVKYFDLAVDEEYPVLEYEVKYGGTIDYFYYPGDVYDSSVNEDIKAEIDEYIEYIKIAGYGKNYDDAYLYTEFEDELGSYYYPNGAFKHEHAINFKWYVEDAAEEYVVFDEEHVFTEDLDLFSKIKKLNVEIIFPTKLTDEVLTLNVPYEESTRFLDSVRDAIFINDHVATFPDITGVEEKFYEKMSNVGGRVFGDAGVFDYIDGRYEINNTDVLIYFYQMMGGKSEYQRWLWEEVETEVENSLGPRGEDTPRSQYESLRSSGLNQEKALYAFFIENRFDLDFDDDLAFAYGRYIDSKKFIEMSTNEDKFLVTENNEFIMEKVEEKVTSLASLDSVITEYGGGRVPEGLLNRLPMYIIEDIYEPRVSRFLDQLDAARDAAANGEPEENCLVDSGVYFDVNLVEELFLPVMDYAKSSHNKAVKKAVNSGNKAAELVEKYYVDNPYTTGKAGNFGVVNYAFDPSFYVDDTDGNGLYTINSFESIYNNVVMPEAVESIDAFLWYMDPDGGSVDLTKVTNLVRDNEALVLALHNHPNNLMAKYAVEGLPKDMVTYWNDLLSDPEIAAAVEKLDDKVDGYKNFDMAFFVETKIQNATLEMYYLKALDKAGIPVENILSKYTNSKAYKELTHEDLEKLLCQLEECWATVDVEIDGVMVPVVNANGTTDYVFDNVLEKVGSSGDVAQAAIKGFEMKITRFFADDLYQVAP